MNKLETPKQTTLVWIDARDAIIAHWTQDQDDVQIERIASDVPAHHKSSGRDGQGGVGSRDNGDPRRNQHLEQFVGSIADRLADNNDLLIIGPGTVCEHLAKIVRAADQKHGHARTLEVEAASRLSDHQLIARLRHFSSDDPLRDKA